MRVGYAEGDVTYAWKAGRLIVTTCKDKSLEIEFNGQTIKLDRLAATDLAKFMARYDAYGHVV